MPSKFHRLTRERKHSEFLASNTCLQLAGLGDTSAEASVSFSDKETQTTHVHFPYQTSSTLANEDLLVKMAQVLTHPSLHKIDQLSSYLTLGKTDNRKID